MELAQYQLQIFVSLVVILGAAFVALICDFLKGNNEQLRELAVELRIRREEEQRRAQTLAPQSMPAQSAHSPALPRPEKQVEAPAASVPVPAAKSARPMAAASADGERKRTPSADALAAMERGARMASSPRPVRAEKPAAEPQVVETSAEKRPARMIEVEKQPEIIQPVAKGKKDWGSLLARANRQSPVVSAAHANTSVTDEASEFPAGFQEGFVLSQLVQNRRPVSGLVVSIGVNTPRNEDGSLPEAVKQLIQSLIGAQDFACQTNDEEFLLIYPQERGASAQRKLSKIAQQLWDFQLRSLGHFQILFSWGGLEVTSEAIDEAIASANERMHETRRGRKLLTMEARPDTPLRKAV